MTLPYYCKKKLKKSVPFLPAVAWFILSFILLTIPGSSLPKENWFDKIPLFDKWVHVGMFAVLVFLICFGLFRLNMATAPPFIKIGIAAFGYGIVMEFVQKYCVVNRSFDFWDILADGAGTAIGVIFSTRRFVKK